LIEYIKCRKIVGGIGEGRIINSKNPINFLSAVDSHTGVIADPLHELTGVSLKNSILIFPHAIGSSVGAYSIFALKTNGVAPSGIICTIKVDITTASGCAIAGIPLAQTINRDQLQGALDHFEAVIDANNGLLKINKV
jgi:predicted aconitase with swiveling domain